MKDKLEENPNKKCFEFYVNGMHCAACELLIEDKLSQMKGVTKVNAKLKSGILSVEGYFKDNEEQLANEFTSQVIDNGYKISTIKQKNNVVWDDFIYAIPISLFIFILFISLQKLGVVSLVSTDKISYPFIFLIGILASLSTCMAVVGGLVLSLSSIYAKEEGSKSIKSQLYFHVGRILSFLILGGLLGFLGGGITNIDPSSSFYISIKFIIDIIIAIVMLVLAINLLDVIPFFNKFQMIIPKFLSKRVLAIQNKSIYSRSENNIINIFIPVFIGAITFFLPCGFTQSIQIQAFLSGSLVNGSLTMLIFALGTLPVLCLISFASIQFSKTFFNGIFFKTSGLIIILLTIVNIIGSLVSIGILSPIFNF